VTQHGADLRRAWTRAFVIGELVGFVAPAVGGATLATRGAPDYVMIPALTVAGMIEGLALGVTQRQVLARYAPEVDGRAWVLATVGAAGFAWFVGMAGGALMGADIEPRWLLVVLLVPAWIAALLAMGWAQWRVLRGAIPNSRRWVTVTAGAWSLGVSIPVVALSTTPNSWPPMFFIVVGVIAAVLMGLTVGTITGRTLARLLDGRTANIHGADHSSATDPINSVH
jgi:hypothetical protein